MVHANDTNAKDGANEGISSVTAIFDQIHSNLATYCTLGRGRSKLVTFLMLRYGSLSKRPRQTQAAYEMIKSKEDQKQCAECIHCVRGERDRLQFLENTDDN